MFIPGKEGKKKKGRSGSNSGSKPGSRSSTPVQTSDQASDTLTQAAKSLKDGEEFVISCRFIITSRCDENLQKIPKQPTNNPIDLYPLESSFNAGGA